MATSIRLSEETEQRLNFLVARTGQTKAFYLKESIEAGIDDMEDYYLASDVLERIRTGQEKVHSADDVRSYLGLDDYISLTLRCNNCNCERHALCDFAILQKTHKKTG